MSILGIILILLGFACIISVISFVIWKSHKKGSIKSKLVDRYVKYRNSEEYTKDRLSGNEKKIIDTIDMRHFCSLEEWKNIEYKHTLHEEVLDEIKIILSHQGIRLTR